MALDVDKVFRYVGEFGLQQKKYCLIIFVSQIAIPCQMILMVIIGAKPVMYCGSDSSKKFTNDQVCDMKREQGKCDRVGFVGDWTTVVEEWGLICSETYKVSMLQSALMAGVLVGSLFWGLVSDTIGRYRTLLLTTTLFFVSSLLSAMTSEYQSFLVCRFFVGVGIAGHGIVSFVLGSELLGSSIRGWFAIMISVLFACGICFLPVFALMVNDWRQLTAFGAALILAVLLVYTRLPESPRWLLSKGRTAGASRVLRHIANGNGVSQDVIAEVLSKTDADDNTEDTSRLVENEKLDGENSKNNESLYNLCSHSSLATIVLVQIYSWFSNSIVYYGLTMAAGDLSDSLYISVALSGAAELPAYALLLILQHKVGRKPLICSTMLMGGVACLAIWLFANDPTSSTMRITLALVGKMGIAASFTIVWLQSAELFPTSVRNAGLGMCAVSARIGGILAPFATMIGNTFPYGHFALFGLIGLSAGLLNLRLPETRAKALPETLDDLLKLAGRYNTSQHKSAGVTKMRSGIV